MIPKFRFFNMKLNSIYNVISIDLYNEKVDCILNKQHLDVITWDIKCGILMQFTGLTDKNGKEIYDGDIIKIIKGIEKEIIIGVVKYSKMLGMWYLEIKGDYDTEIRLYDNKEVIGNIYKNHDLLE